MLFRSPVSVPLGRMLGGHTVMEALIAPGSLMVRPQDSIDVLLRWRARPAATGETVDVQLRGADGRVVVSAPRRLGEDGQGGNRGGASDQVADLHTLVTPRTLQPGAYSVVAVVGADETLLADIRVELSPPTR